MFSGVFHLLYKILIEIPVQANGVDSDQMQCSVTSGLGLQCFVFVLKPGSLSCTTIVFVVDETNFDFLLIVA